MAFYQKNFALITGASSGIGKAIAVELARRKISLILVALPGTGLEQTASDIATEHNITVLHYAIDLTHENASEKIFMWCRANEVVVRILVNNAGVGNIGYLEDCRTDTLSTILLLNNHAMMMLTHSFLSQMKRHAPGYILNVGSLASFLPIPKKAVYSASKSFVYSFSCSLGNELKDSGISVSCLCPGSTVTSETVKQNLQSTSYQGSLFTQTARQVAAEGVEQMFRKKRRIIPGWPNKFLFLLWTILPYSIASAILTRIFNKNRRPQKILVDSLKRPLLSIALVQR
jgi:short-subunit dehydrogenase